jgi:hypothetical protein
MSLYILDTDILQLFQDEHPLVIARVRAIALEDRAISVVSVEEQLSGWYAQLRQAKRPERLAWAYVYLNAFDYFVKQTVRARYYIHYVDDYVLCSAMTKVGLRARRSQLPHRLSR